jgi:hypothetical protein
MNNRIAFWATKTSTLKKQRGVAAVVVTIGMIALLAVTGLALDSGHLLMNKTRIQNAVDAAALTAARTLQTTNGDMTQARNNADTTFNSNLSGELSGQNPAITVTFSENLNPGSFTSSVTDPKFVKVATSSIPLQSFLVRLVGFDSKEVAGIAVAGFAQGANICNLIPVVVCSGSYTGSDSIYGYKKYDPSTYSADDVITLKVGSGDGPDTDVGTGSFHLLNLPGLQGADDIRYAFAGSPSCATKSQPFQINVAPGNKVGPTVQGINTRFGLYSGPLNGDQHLYPPDQANDNNGPHCDGGGSDACPDPVSYFDFYANNAISSTSPQYQRRIVGVPIANCSVAAHGSNTPDSMQTPVGFGCFLLTEPASQQGGAGNNSDGSGSFKGFFIEDCTPPGSGVTTSSGAEIIVLYKNPDGGDS